MDSHSTKKGRPRRDLRQDIVSLAEELFFARGVRSVSLEELVQNLATSKSAFYRYFSDKEALVQAVMERLNRRMNADITTIVDSEVPFSHKLVAVARYTSELLGRVSDRFFEDLRNLTPAVWEQYMKDRQRRVDTLYRRLFEVGQAEGELRTDLPASIVTMIYLKMTELVVDPETIRVFREHDHDPYDVIQSAFMEGIERKPSQAQKQSHKDKGGPYDNSRD